MSINPRLALPTLALGAALGLVAGCSVEQQDPVVSTTPSSPGLTLQDGWVKATEEPMTGVFGTLTNTTSEDIHLTSVECDLAAMAELHVTVDDGAGGRLMQEAEDGFIIPAGGSHALAPGGDHLMLMALAAPVETGQDVDLTLVTEDGTEYDISVTARAFTGAEEHYVPEDDTATTSQAP